MVQGTSNSKVTAQTCAFTRFLSLVCSRGSITEYQCKSISNATVLEVLHWFGGTVKRKQRTNRPTSCALCVCMCVCVYVCVCMCVCVCVCVYACVCKDGAREVGIFRIGVIGAFASPPASSPASQAPTFTLSSSICTIQSEFEDKRTRYSLYFL